MTGESTGFINKNYGCVIPVAGLSQRMGDFKPLMVLADGQPMIVHTVLSALQAKVENCVLVLGYQAERIEKQFINFAQKQKICFVYNESFATSDMLSSIQLGLRELSRFPNIEAAYILPGDMPCISAATFVHLASRFAAGTCQVVLPKYQHQVKHPPLISKDCFAHIIRYAGTGGLRQVLTEFGDNVVTVEIDDRGCCLDADTIPQFQVVKNFTNWTGN
jgi:CTP:molybdopterin cytidylyltransferase MocA